MFRGVNAAAKAITELGSDEWLLAARAPLWARVDTDREAALELRRRVQNDLRVHEAHCTHLSRQAPQDAGELVSAQAALAKARTELERLETILARP